MRLLALAKALAFAAAIVTVVVVRDPSMTTAGYAALLWAWALVAWREGKATAHAPGCHACGRSGDGVLPDGSCAWCAAPPRPRGAGGRSAKGS